MIALTEKEMETIKRVKKSYMATKKIKEYYRFGEALKEMYFDDCREWDDFKISGDDFEVIDKIIDKFLDSESEIDFIEDYLDTL